MSETFPEQLALVKEMVENDHDVLTGEERAALAAVLDAVPQWLDRPSSPGIWLTCEMSQYRFHRVQQTDIPEWKSGECYGPIPKASSDDFQHVSVREAFAALREASAGRWDNVDADQHVRELRGTEEESMQAKDAEIARLNGMIDRMCAAHRPQRTEGA